MRLACARLPIAEDGPVIPLTAGLFRTSNSTGIGCARITDLLGECSYIRTEEEEKEEEEEEEEEEEDHQGRSAQPLQPTSHVLT